MKIEMRDREKEELAYVHRANDVMLRSIIQWNVLNDTCILLNFMLHSETQSCWVREPCKWHEWKWQIIKYNQMAFLFSFFIHIHKIVWCWRRKISIICMIINFHSLHIYFLLMCWNFSISFNMHMSIIANKKP